MTSTDLIDLDAAASMLGVNKQTLRRWDESGRLKAHRAENGYRQYLYSDVIEQLGETKARPFVKWAGGKSQLLPELLKRVPATFNNYLEPFIGGGAFFFALMPKRAFLNDSNTELIQTYRAIKSKPEELVWLLEEYKEKHSEDFYYGMRSRDVSTLDDVEVAARFIYLNKTCFNGLYRVNQSGAFNVPMGNYANPSIVDEKNILNCSRALKYVTLTNMDYRDFLYKHAQKGDFIYLDPPYLPVSEYSDFDRYSKEKFRIGDQIELATCYTKLVRLGAHPLLSNSSSEIARKLYSTSKVETVLATRSINKDGAKRGKVDEILVSPGRETHNFPSTRYMGSKTELLGHISKIVEDLNVNSVLDAFSGSGVVSYQFKKMGLKVISNDFLSYSHAVTNALIENNDEILDSEDIEMLLKKNSKASDFVQKTFDGLYFNEEDNKFLDNTIANIKTLKSPYKRSLAYASLSRACLKRRPRGIFTYVGFRYDDGRKDLSFSLREHFLFSVSDYNQAVFDNGLKNESLNLSALDLKNVNVDLVYMDPPYFSKHSDNDYVRRYHFIEGICRDWKGVEIQQDTLTKKFKKYESPFGSRDGAYAAFDQMISQFKKSKILISYSSNSLPTKEELIDMLKKHGKKVKVIEIDYKYSFGNQGNKVSDNNNQVKEYLFLGY